MNKRTFVFQGMCYSGKTTLGKLLANHLNVDFLDSRDLFFKIHGVSEIYYLKTYGKEKFIQAEKESLQQDFQNVFSCGGSAIYYPNEMNTLHEKYEIIWLDAELDVILKRKHYEGTERPIVYPTGINSFEELYQERCKLYKQYFTHRIKIAQDEDPHVTLQKIIKIINSS
tara:strand:- start:263 stop:772 length:510 start_codon:yes stop_codon:yes gene_type:complete